MRRRHVVALLLAAIPAACFAGSEDEVAPRRVDVTEHGAVGDCRTDDTEAIQSAADALRDGDALYFPSTPDGRCYRLSRTIFVDGRSDVTLSGYDATLVNETDSRALIAVIGPRLPSRTDRSWAETVNGDHFGAEVEGVRVLGFRGRMQPSRPGGHNLGFNVAWCRGCEVRDVEIVASNGNGIELRQCVDCVAEDNRVSGFKNFGIFAFQNLRSRIAGNHIDGEGYGERGIDVKQTYRGEPSNGTIVEGNTLVDLTDQYWITGGTWCEARSEDPIYVDGHERTADVVVRDNELRTERGSTPPRVTVGVFAEGWSIVGNRFHGNGKPGFALSLGAAGNPGECGTALQGNHLVADNEFLAWDARDGAVIGLGAGAVVRDNRVEGDVRWIVAYREHCAELAGVDRIEVTNNRFRGSMPADAVRAKGVSVAPDAGVRSYSAGGNEVAVE